MGPTYSTPGTSQMVQFRRFFKDSVHFYPPKISYSFGHNVDYLFLPFVTASLLSKFVVKGQNYIN